MSCAPTFRDWNRRDSVRGGDAEVDESAPAEVRLDHAPCPGAIQMGPRPTRADPQREPFAACRTTPGAWSRPRLCACNTRCTSRTSAGFSRRGSPRYLRGRKCRKSIESTTQYCPPAASPARVPRDRLPQSLPRDAAMLAPGYGTLEYTFSSLLESWRSPDPSDTTYNVARGFPAGSNSTRPGAPFRSTRSTTRFLAA